MYRCLFPYMKQTDRIGISDLGQFMFLFMYVDNALSKSIQVLFSCFSNTGALRLASKSEALFYSRLLK